MEEDQSELLQDSEEESGTETEEQDLPVDKPNTQNRHNFVHVHHTKKEFVISKVLLILSTLSVIILLPLYMETVNTRGDVYSLILTNSLLATVILVLVMTALKYVSSKYKYIPVLKPPIKLTKLGQLSLLYFLSGILIIYTLDRKRVICHLQDPTKGLILVWSFLYYFFFCQRFMCLQRIFSVTMIIIGLFVSLDFSLCNEFKCRGYERERTSDDTGNWMFQTHAIWTVVYVLGLALCAAYFTLLEQVFVNDIETESDQSNYGPLVNSVSHTVSTNSASASTQHVNEVTYFYKRISVIHLAMWMHVFGAVIVLVCYWSDFVPEVGKGDSGSAVLDYTAEGIKCHFSSGCSDLPLFSWLFLFGYLVFVISSIQFLMLTQSAVYTVATMTTTLPLAQIFWSFFNMVPIENGLIIWNPSFTGELISSLLGLPIIITGLYFLYRAHFKDYYWRGTIASNPPSECP